jgi:hypothetical protein
LGCSFEIPDIGGIFSCRHMSPNGH